MGALENLINKINKDAKETIVFTGKTDYSSIKRMPVSSARLNRSLYGGIAENTVIEIFGLEGSGKTTLALDFVKSFQKQQKKEGTNKKTLYLDVESTLSEEWGELLGIDFNDVIQMKPMSQSAEQMLQRALEFVQTGEIGLVVIDSIPALVTEHEQEAELADSLRVGGIAMTMQRFDNKMVPLLKKYGCMLIGINQQRDKIGAFIPTLITPGGKHWKYTCNLRIEVKRGKAFNAEGKELAKSSEEQPVGHRIDYYIEKNKTSKDDRKRGFFILNYSYGIDKGKDIYDCLWTAGMVHQKGTEYFLDLDKAKTKQDNPTMYPSKEAIMEALRNNDELYDHYYKLFFAD